MRLPARCLRMAAAIGERTALRLPAKRTAPGRSASPGSKASALPMQGADQGEQASGGGDVDENLALEPLHEEPASFVMQATPSHIDRLDAGGRLALDRLVVALAHQEVVLHQAAEGREREHHMHDWVPLLVADGEHQAIVGEQQMQRVRAAVMVLEREGVALEQIEDGDLALMLDVYRVAPDRSGIERHLDEPRLLGCKLLLSPSRHVR